MRLSKAEIGTIKSAVKRHFGEDASVKLFGSRTDNAKKGGDIDLYVNADLADAQEAIRAETAFWAELQKQLGEQRIDVLVDYPAKKTRPLIYRVAREQGVPL